MIKIWIKKPPVKYFHLKNQTALSVTGLFCISILFSYNFATAGQTANSKTVEEQLEVISFLQSYAKRIDAAKKEMDSTAPNIENLFGEIKTLQEEIDTLKGKDNRVARKEKQDKVEQKIKDLAQEIKVREKSGLLLREILNNTISNRRNNENKRKTR